MACRQIRMSLRCLESWAIASQQTTLSRAQLQTAHLRYPTFPNHRQNAKSASTSMSHRRARFDNLRCSPQNKTNKTVRNPPSLTSPLYTSPLHRARLSHDIPLHSTPLRTSTPGGERRYRPRRRRTSQADRPSVRAVAACLAINILHVPRTAAAAVKAAVTKDALYAALVGGRVWTLFCRATMGLRSGSGREGSGPRSSSCIAASKRTSITGWDDFPLPSPPNAAR